MIKRFQDFLNENESTKNFERALDMVVYMSLGYFSPNGGNCLSEWVSSGKIPDEIFGPAGPDLWIDCGDFGGKIPEELEMVAENFNHPSKRDYLTNDFDLHTRKVIERFEKYGLIVETLIDNQVKVRVLLPDTNGALPFYQYHQRASLPESWKAIVKFYTEIQPKGLKELENRIGKGYLGGKKIGLI